MGIIFEFVFIYKLEKFMKFLHISDIHLGRKQVGNSGDFAKKRYYDFFSAFEYMINYAIESKLDAVIIAGDLFDKKEINPDILHNTINILTKAKNNNLPVICIEGNHDNFQSDNVQDSWLIYLESLDLLKRPYHKFQSDEEYHFVPIVLGDIHFWGIGYNGAFTEQVIEKFANYISTQNTKNVLITHTAIAGDKLFHGTVKSDAITQLKGHCIYVAGGHFHNFSAYPTDSPFFFVPGSLEYWDNGEFHQKKGGIVFDTDTLEYSYVNSNNRKVLVIKLENNFETAEDFYNYFNQEIKNYENRFDTEQIVGLEIKNNTTFYPDASILEDAIYEKGALRVFTSFSTNNYRNSQSISNNNMLLEEIEEEIISKWEYFSSDVKQSVETLKLLKEYQSVNSNENIENFKNIFDSWLLKLIEGQEK